MRTSKTVGGITTQYYWLGDKLQAQSTGNDYLIFLYDEAGVPYGLIHKNGSTEITYYYEYNLQGDIIGIISDAGTRVVTYQYSAWGELLSASGSMATSIGATNPLRYRGYYYDSETGFYYLQSRYYDPQTGRFLNADSYVSTGQGLLGNNMFAYCLNNPVNCVDRSGNNTEAAHWWTSTMWWLCGADTALPVGDIIYVVGILILGFYDLIVADEVTLPQVYLEEEEEKAEPETPDVTYPGDDPAKAPDGYEWKGKGEQGSKEGSYFNPESGEGLHPDLNHPEGKAPHWDYNYRGSGVKGWRIFPDGTFELKK